jgi:predicted O-methyltransferase YrrM
MPSTLLTPQVAGVLDRLFADAEGTDAPVRAIEQARTAGDAPASPPPGSDMERLLSQAYLPVDRDTGRFLYALVVARARPTVVEFGTSFGISTIHLAAAVRDGGGGRVISTEMQPAKASRARQNLQEAGLLDWVEVREGDALQTLRGLEGAIDLLFLDGWKDLYLPVLRLLESQFRAGALVLGDDTDKFAGPLRPYLEYVRRPESGYVSVRVPIGDGLEMSVRVP